MKITLDANEVEATPISIASAIIEICKFNKMPYEALYNTKEVAMHLLAYCTNRARWEGEADDE